MPYDLNLFFINLDTIFSYNKSKKNSFFHKNDTHRNFNIQVKDVSHYFGVLSMISPIVMEVDKLMEFLEQLMMELRWVMMDKLIKVLEHLMGVRWVMVDKLIKVLAFDGGLEMGDGGQANKSLGAFDGLEMGDGVQANKGLGAFDGGLEMGDGGQANKGLGASDGLEMDDGGQANKRLGAFDGLEMVYWEIRPMDIGLNFDDINEETNYNLLGD